MSGSARFTIVTVAALLAGGGLPAQAQPQMPQTGTLTLACKGTTYQHRLAGYEDIEQPISMGIIVNFNPNFSLSST